MEVIAHQAPSVKQPVCFFTALTQLLKKQLAVAVTVRKRVRLVYCRAEISSIWRTFNLALHN
jgi:hypothetical protein